MLSKTTNLAIETQEQSALIIGQPHPLLQGIADYLTKKNFIVLRYSLDRDLSSLVNETLEPDYIFIYNDEAFETWVNTPGNENHLLTFLQNSLQINSRIIGIIPWRFRASSWIKKIDGGLCKLIFLGQLYGVGIIDDSVVSKYLKTAIIDKTITISGDGLRTHHIINIQDAIQGVSQTALSPYQEDQVFISNPEPISELNLAYKIRSSMHEKINIEFSKSSLEKESNQEIIIPKPPNINWQPQIELGNVLPKLSKWMADSSLSATRALPLAEKPKTIEKESRTKLQPLKKAAPRKIIPNRPKKRPKKPKTIEFVKKKEAKLSLLSRLKQKKPTKKRRKINPILKSALLAFAIYFISIIVSSSLLVIQGQKALRGIRNNQPLDIYSFASAPSKIATTYLKANLSFLESLPAVGESNKLKELQTVFQAITLVQDTITRTVPITNAAQKLARHLLGQEQTDLVAQQNTIKREIDSIYQNISLLEGLLSSPPPSILPKSWQDKYVTATEKLIIARKTILQSKKVASILDDILAFNSTKKYAILLQNNMEIRPTGGFIGSLAIMSLENGELYDLQLYDVYSADGQLKGHVEPPEAIKEYLGEANWYLRDSNWDPDFPNTARRAEWFINKTLNQKIDGTIAINLYTMQNILNALGPIELPDYQEKITKDNLFERAEYHSEINFFPGSTQKKEFLASLTDAIFLKLENLDNTLMAKSGLALLNSLNSKHTLVSLQSAESNQVLSQLGWNGEIKETICPSNRFSNCLKDYLNVIDANVGINKANYFIERKIDLAITVLENMYLKHNLTLTYTNTATSGAWPAGNYKNYQRIILPSFATKIKVRVGDEEIERQKLQITRKNNKTYVGYLITIPIKTTKAVEISYQLTEKFPTDESPYVLYWQKQSGTKDDPLTITFNYPDNLKPKLISPEAILADGQIIFNLSNSTDLSLTIQLSQLD